MSIRKKFIDKEAVIFITSTVFLSLLVCPKKNQLSQHAAVASPTNSRSTTPKRSLRLLTQVALCFSALIGGCLKEVIHKVAGIAEE